MIVNLERLPEEPCQYADEPQGLRGRAKDPGRALGITQLGLDLHTLQPGQENARYHREQLEDEFFLVHEGRCQLRLEGKAFALETGDFVYVPYGVAHSFYNDGEEPCAIWMGGECREGGAEYPEPPSQWTRAEGKPPYSVNLAKVTPKPVQYDGEAPGMRGLSLDLSEAVGMQRICTSIHLLAPGQQDSRPHFHQKEEQLFVIMAGHPVLRLGDRHVLAKPGDCIFVPTGTPHCFLNPSQESTWIWMMHAVSFEADTYYVEEESHVGRSN